MSPFNECAHAYLAAARALLLHLRAVQGVDHDAVEALIGKIEAEMLANGASLTLCRFSDEPFNTNEIVFPRWSEVPLHPLTAVFAALVLAGIVGGVGRVAQAEPESAKSSDIGFAHALLPFTVGCRTFDFGHHGHAPSGAGAAEQMTEGCPDRRYPQGALRY